MVKHKDSMTSESNHHPSALKEDSRNGNDVLPSRMNINKTTNVHSLDTAKENGVSPPKKRVYDQTKRKYIVFVCSFMQRFLVGGFASMISVMFVDIVREFDTSRSEASLMQSLLRGFMYGGGFFGEIVIRKIGFTKSVLGGCTLVSVSLLASSFATNATTVVILIGVGTGSGLVFPLLSTFISIGRAFDHLSFPKFVSYTVAGGGVGSIVLPYVAELMLVEYGWRGMCLILSGIMANLILFAIALHFNLPREKPPDQRGRRAPCDVSIWRSPMFIVCFAICIPLGLTGFVETWYVPDYLVTIGYTREEGSIQLTVIGAASAFGRFFAGLAHPICTYTKTDIIYHWIYINLVIAGAHVMYPLFPDYMTLFAPSILYGVFFGMLGSQFSPVVNQAVGRSRYPQAQAIVSSVFGLCNTIGGFIAGSITDITGSYDMVFYMAGICCVCSSICIAVFLIYNLTTRTTKKRINMENEMTHI